MPTILLAAVLLAVILYTVLTYRKKLRSGCCGSGGDKVRRIGKAADSEAYPYAAHACIDGMMCQNCAARIENAINAEADLHGKVELGKKLLTVRGKSPIDEARVRQLVARVGYRVISFQCK